MDVLALPTGFVPLFDDGYWPVGYVAQDNHHDYGEDAEERHERGVYVIPVPRVEPIKKICVSESGMTPAQLA